MNKYEKGALAITNYLKSHPEEKGRIVDRATVYGIAHSAFPDISIEKENMLPTDMCWNIINGRDPKSKMLSDFQNWPHALLAEEEGFRLVGSDYNYEGPVFHRGWEKNYGYWKSGVFYKEDDLLGEKKLSEEIIHRIKNLKLSLEEALKSFPINISVKSNELLLYYQASLICGVCVEEETYKIFNVSLKWKNNTTYYCIESDDNTWFYYLDTMDECIGQVKRIVLLETNNEFDINGSELKKYVNLETFERLYRSFLNQADKNAVSKKSEGSRIPEGIVFPNTNNTFDGGGLGCNYGQGAASNTPYLSWYVVSIYYIVNESRIVLGIEKDRYRNIEKMKPLKFEQIGNKKSLVAVFYETSKDSINYSELFDRFMLVSEEIIGLGVN